MIELWKELNNSKYVFTNQGRKNKPMWKITDVSKMAGVSTATVSRVLNNKDRVDPETRKKVLEVIKKLGYVPHSIGRSLSQRKTKNVGFIVSNPKNSIQSDIFFYEIMLSMSRVFNKHGISLLTEETHGEYQDEESLPLMIYPLF
ncbi:MAG: LacI family DNA-binding transcriptional regulator [Candidatus Atribacteria bacterium]|nr:LacI family DNA-binding transcriptional regulator [Candidatus Atribacteria bacterium]